GGRFHHMERIRPRRNGDGDEFSRRHAADGEVSRRPPFTNLCSQQEFVMKKYSFGRGKQKGIGLLDLLFWLVIASLLSFGVLRLVKNNMTKAAVADEVDTLSMMAGDLRAKFMRTGNFAGLTNATFVSLNIAPPERVTGGNLRSAFETPIDVSAANVNGMANDGFSFTYSNL